MDPDTDNDRPKPPTSLTTGLLIFATPLDQRRDRPRGELNDMAGSPARARTAGGGVRPRPVRAFSALPVVGSGPKR